MTHMTLQAVRQLIANDSYAITFQSIEQYRAALLRHFDSLAGNSVASQQVLAATDDHVLMPRHLTAENGAKGLLSGEFKEVTAVRCHECDGEGADPESDNPCTECDGTGSIEQPVPIAWDTIKRIYAMAVENLAVPEPGKALPAKSRVILEEALYALDLVLNQMDVPGLSGQRAYAARVLMRAAQLDCGTV